MHSHTGRALLTAVVGVLLLAGAAPAAGQSPITYHLSFPALEHHEVQVEIDLPGLGSGPLDVHMSRSSPGRYSLHEFAKNVYDVEVSGARSFIALKPG